MLQAGLTNQPANTGGAVHTMGAGSQSSHLDSFFEGSQMTRDDALIVLTLIELLVLVAMWRGGA